VHNWSVATRVNPGSKQLDDLRRIGDIVTDNYLADQANKHLQILCEEFQNRCVGSTGNRRATDYFNEQMITFGFQTESPQFECIDWSEGDVQLTLAGETFPARVSPYSLGCNVTAPLVVATSIEELENTEVSKKILLLHGEITKEQLMPKNFTFYNPEHHQRIIALLERKNPFAIISATTRDPELAGGIYPFPLIEDGDFDIPSVYTTEEIGEDIAWKFGQEVSLTFEATRNPSTGCNVIARKGDDSTRRIVIFAHIDAKINTPGALDNGTGVTVLLLLAELLKERLTSYTIEIVALNGEDYYSAPGEMLYLQENLNQLQDVILGINLDGAGYSDGRTAYSLYDCPPDIVKEIYKSFADENIFLEGEQWYQSDHSLFLMKNRPALAITSEKFMHLSTYITHTEKDTPQLVNSGMLAEIALALKNLLLGLDGQ
jgi:aminopeptidase YwaD